MSPAQHGGHGRGDHGSARTAVAEQDHVPGLFTVPWTGNKTVIWSYYLKNTNTHYILVDFLHHDASMTATYS